MIAADLLDDLRSELDDVAQPYLWTEAELLGYLNDAQIQFCRATGGIADATSAMTQVAVTAGDVYVDYDPRILRVRRASEAGVGRALQIVNFEVLESGQPSGWVMDETVGTLSHLITGLEANKFRLLKVPAADLVLALVVNRLPLASIDTSTLASELEIDERHHEHLTKWAKYRAHQKQDAETFDRGQAREHRQEFLDYTNSARRDIEKREHTPRAVRYAGL